MSKSNITASDLNDIRDYPYFNKVNGIGHYCVFATDLDPNHNNGYVYGWNWLGENSDGVFVVYVQTCIDHGANPDQFAVSKSFMHELGHNLGLNQYPQSPIDSSGWAPYYAGNTCMVIGNYDYLGYLTEDSNINFYWTGCPGSTTLFGWEYSYDDPWTDFPHTDYSIGRLMIYHKRRMAHASVYRTGETQSTHEIRHVIGASIANFYNIN